MNKKTKKQKLQTWQKLSSINSSFNKRIGFVYIFFGIWGLLGTILTICNRLGSASRLQALFAWDFSTFTSGIVTMWAILRLFIAPAFALILGLRLCLVRKYPLEHSPKVLNILAIIFAVLSLPHSTTWAGSILSMTLMGWLFKIWYTIMYVAIFICIMSSLQCIGKYSKAKQPTIVASTRSQQIPQNGARLAIGSIICSVIAIGGLMVLPIIARGYMWIVPYIVAQYWPISILLLMAILVMGIVGRRLYKRTTTTTTGLYNLQLVSGTLMIITTWMLGTMLLSSLQVLI